MLRCEAAVHLEAVTRALDVLQVTLFAYLVMLMVLQQHMLFRLSGCDTPLFCPCRGCSLMLG